MTSCSRCLLTTQNTTSISFNAEGLCNYCQYYDQVSVQDGNPQQRENWINHKVSEIRQKGAKGEFDCIVGVSGGVDSSYLAYWAKEKGLRPLVVHFDNGWNSELATENIQNICEKLGFALNTY